MAGDARDFAFEKRELGIWLDKIVDAKRQLSLAPEGVCAGVVELLGHPFPTQIPMLLYRPHSPPSVL